MCIRDRYRAVRSIKRRISPERKTTKKTGAVERHGKRAENTTDGRQTTKLDELCVSSAKGMSRRVFGVERGEKG